MTPSMSTTKDPLEQALEGYHLIFQQPKCSLLLLILYARALAYSGAKRYRFNPPSRFRRPEA